MPRLIKAYSERDLTVLEISVFALTEAGAKYKALGWAFSRRQTQAREYEDVKVVELNGDGLKEYRVMVKTDTQNSIRDELADKVGRML